VWLHELPALGLPGVSTWKPSWALLLDGLDVYVWQEPGKGGESLVERLSDSLPQARILVPTEGLKDVSEYHCQGGEVVGLLQGLMRRAQSVSQLKKARINKERALALVKAGDLARSPDILSELEILVQQLGLSGEARNARLLYLALTSRLLDRPVSVAIKGPSSGGKSFLTETVLETMPEEAYHRYTSMSDRALLYTDLDLRHRFLVVMEGTALKGYMAAYIMRSLLSEGGLDHQTVVKGDDGMEGKHLRVEGPTGLLVTTTSEALDPELETRLFSIEVGDDAEQTRSILQATAEQANCVAQDRPDLEPWHALQRWLQMGQHSAVVPYAPWLAENTKCVALRLRRDFKAVLQLIKAHAILHQKARLRDEDGRIVADLADYRAVYELVATIISELADVAVPRTIKETVEAVRAHIAMTRQPADRRNTAFDLQLDVTTAGRRLRTAWKKGYLRRVCNKPVLYRLGDSLPQETSVLPCPQELVAMTHGGEVVSNTSESSAFLHSWSQECKNARRIS